MEDESSPDDDGPPLIRAKNLEEYLGISRIYLKLENLNPTGTHKDRISKVHVAEAVRLGFSGITTGTCGNYGFSLAYFAWKYGLKGHIFVPKYYSNTKISLMRKHGAVVHLIEGSYEDAVFESRKFAEENNLYDANPGSKPWLDYKGYAAISSEIVRLIKPYAVFIPIGNGTTLAGIYHGFRRLGLNPHMIGVTTSLGNQVLNAFYKNDFGGVKDIAETPLNEPLVSSISFDLNNTLKAIRNSNGYVFGFADDTALRYTDLLEKFEGINALPASALVLAGLVKFVKKFGVNGEDFVLILTGGLNDGKSSNLSRR